MTDGHWISTDEADDVAGSLRHAIRVETMVRNDPLAWKWLLLALHSALQGACVCHLTTTASPVGAVTDRNAKEWLDYFNRIGDHPPPDMPQTHLLVLPDLLKAIRKPASAGDRSNTTGVRLNDSELAWLNRLHTDVRNQFVHFAPMGWSIDVSGVAPAAALIARIIGEIDAMGWGFRHHDQAWHEALRHDLDILSADRWPKVALA